MTLTADPIPELSTRTWNVLRFLEITTRTQLIAALEDGSLVKAGLGPRSLAELRRALGWDPPLTPAPIPTRCPKCGGESGFRIRVVQSELRHYSWQEVLESVSEIRVESKARIECRDCDARLPIRFSASTYP